MIFNEFKSYGVNFSGGGEGRLRKKSHSKLTGGREVKKGQNASQNHF